MTCVAIKISSQRALSHTRAAGEHLGRQEGIQVDESPMGNLRETEWREKEKELAKDRLNGG